MQPIAHERQDQAEIDSDCLLMARIANQDRVAFELLLEKYHYLLRNIVWKICRDQHLVDDIMQEASVAVWQKASYFDPSKGVVIGWLVLAFRRKAIDAIRKVSRIHRQADELEAAATHDIDDWKPSDHLMRQEAVDLVRSRIRVLPINQRMAVWLCYIKEMSQSEAAAYLQIPLGTLKARLKRALDKLCVSISAHGGLRQS